MKIRQVALLLIGLTMASNVNAATITVDGKKGSRFTRLQLFSAAGIRSAVCTLAPKSINTVNVNDSDLSSAGKTFEVFIESKSPKNNKMETDFCGTCKLSTAKKTIMLDADNQPSTGVGSINSKAKEDTVGFKTGIRG